LRRSSEVEQPRFFTLFDDLLNAPRRTSSTCARWRWLVVRDDAPLKNVPLMLLDYQALPILLGSSGLPAVRGLALGEGRSVRARGVK
jgi:hypothetical protein